MKLANDTKIDSFDSNINLSFNYWVLAFDKWEPTNLLEALVYTAGTLSEAITFMRGYATGKGSVTMQILMVKENKVETYYY